MVSAWATANHISLGQVVVDEKSNEITAIPKLLELLELSGCLVTIDAMGCQTEIAEKIVEGKADYVLAVKANQPTLHDGDRGVLPRPPGGRLRPGEGQPPRDEGEGARPGGAPVVLRVRRARGPARPGRWKGLKRIGVAISDTVRGGKPCDDVRYYILSRKLSGPELRGGGAGHWGIENSLHWQLDVTFGEDRSRVRKGHADANSASLRRTALSLLKNETSQKVGIKNKRLTAGWNDDYLEQVLFGHNLWCNRPGYTIGARSGMQGIQTLIPLAGKPP